MATGNGKRLFITRFFFPKEELNLNKYFAGVLPQKSKDSYLSVNKHRISL
jgi:hypothetical protein